ncbi:MAG: tRNA uridine-5-carboxymethylaminomethyl(34) synthesis GTPase MnmE [Candidatus Omnitrophota bacterium]|nr:tRNA uridine-5-carboxymethylaminomethyl(34) synthesis GTPase MnmE [Candidatus Omnitrophota bacterium]
MKDINLFDTIAAIATPLGQGGIGIVRLSGKKALAIADEIFTAKDGVKPSRYKSHTVHYGWIVEKAKVKSQKEKIVDEVLLTVMRAPRSYTKEDIVEISCHGGIVVLREILDLVLAKGARAAQRGEFTKRAFLNGRIDLSRAEAVLDVINAKTRYALESSISQLRGSLSKEVHQLKDKLIEVSALLEANINFPEEEITPANLEKVNSDVAFIKNEVDKLLDSAVHGKILREGLSAVILGRANTGKSSLLNALLKEERVIVSPVAGTTRDAVEEILDIRGIPLKIADTAGIIEPKDLIEQEALKRTRRYFDKADLVLLVFDSSSRLTPEDRLLIKKARAKTTIAVLNKCDLKPRIEEAEIKIHFDRLVKISSLKRKGLKELEEKIVQSVWEGKLEASDELIISNARHIQALKKAKEALARARDSLKDKLSIEFIAEDLRLTQESLGLIIGASAGEDILDKIFSQFCIGK